MSDANWYDPKTQAEATLEVMKLGAKAQSLIADFLAKNASEGATAPYDPLNISSAFVDLSAKMMSDPSKLAEAQMQMWGDYMKLWQATSMKMMGQDADPVIEAHKGDKRFKSDDWRDNQIFDFIKQSYLLTSKYVNEAVENTEGLSEKDKAKTEFYTKQFLDAVSPTNFVLTNPDVLKATVEEKGQNLIRGLENIIEDLERGKGQLSIKMTDLDAFEVGRNIAVTPGDVVFENRMFQLIQYKAQTKEVFEIPILFLPPWINKFYILDLSEKKSLIRWLVEQGFTVYCVSWVNPDGSYKDVSFEDYMKEGALEAIAQVRKHAKVEQLHIVGYCIAGTLLASTLAYLSAKGEADQIKSATFFTAQVDFEDAGELQIFVDEDQIEAIDQSMASKGYLDASSMATTFNLLRSNDLIWSFVVNNYLLGKDPFPFDLLYWNADSTRMPRAMHRYYLKNFYLENNLIKPGHIALDGVPIDLSKIKTDIYVQAGKDDHIAPFRSVYKMPDHFSGDTRFVLAGSGHIAGVVNPPSAQKYQYWTHDKREADPDIWLEKAEEHPGSWWPDWQTWLEKRSGDKIKARKVSKSLEAAPGRYVKVKG